MPQWEILFPQVSSPDPIPVVTGRFIASGVGPPGQIHDLHGELFEVKGGVSTSIAVGRAVRNEDVKAGRGGRDQRSWVILFHIGAHVLDPLATYTIELFVTHNPNRGPVSEHRLPGYKLEAFTDAPPAKCPPGEPTPLRPTMANIIHPASGATVSRYSISAYGSAQGETVSGAKLEEGVACVAGSAGHQHMPNGFWWVSFNEVPAGQNPPGGPWPRTIRVITNVQPDATRNVSMTS